MSAASTGLFENRCPFCGKGAIFHSVILMHRTCPGCGHVFEREPGFFIGAMVFSYLLSCGLAVPAVAFGILVLHGDPFTVLATTIGAVVLLTPLLIRFSRLIWIQVDARAQRKIDRDEAARGSR